MISFVDSVPVVPDCANNKSHEYFDDCAEDLFHDVRLERFSRLDILYSIAFIFYMAQARFNHFAEDSDKMRVIVASAETRHRWFVQDFFSLTSNFIIPGVMAHGQCWVMLMRLALFNPRVHTDEDLRIYNTSGIRAFSPIIADLVGLTCEEIVEKLKNCTVAQGFARRDGCDIDDELTKVRMQAILDGCQKGGRIVGKAHADRWKCLREAFELFSEHMMKEYAVEASFEEDFLPSITEFFDGDESIDISKAIKELEDDILYKQFVANNARKCGHATKDQLDLLDRNRERTRAANNNAALKAREAAGFDTVERQHECRECGNIQSFMIGQMPTCNGKGCGKHTKWNCLDNEKTTKFDIDRKAIAAVTLPVDKIPEPNKDWKYTGEFFMT